MTAFLLISCGASIKSSFTEQLKPLTIENKVAFLDLEHPLPENVKKLAKHVSETVASLPIAASIPI